ncbi:uncharacterized protein BO88DRAFT_402379 [Aspergillus vadensis CBS 113365]|uniref:Uncharacterized protein n=1 Tax=Aspergillus vadensis (strain CBS 113365 / IMI 142717 / IBT 24658) TaxID=1448311 RepID=A0A319BJM2_ASPVC|nr:hypothetical protein BO88DRAFT_402379 [Aspergillus vadensis CBS 113365]PYH72109.1 hypothetical protein BO88DRAFT_402379 [Aspergillus vadensis CBS 113365]
MSAFEVKDDYNIQKAWESACGAFAQMTKVDLTTSPKFTVDEVLDQIRIKQDEDDEKNTKFKAAKDIIGKTLTLITVLGGIAAQGASMVFAPSSLCFNAVSYLIATGAKYKRIFSSLALLFRRISDVLERCRIYMRLPADAVDISLRKIINEELVCFVDICALSIKVLEGNKILTALKVFAFDSDKGVSGQLDRLALLVERESQMRATLEFESQKTSELVMVETRHETQKVNASVDKLLTFEKKRDADNMAQRLLSNIDASLGTPSETYKAIQAIYKRRLNEQVSGSGEWLKHDPLYTAWADVRRSRFSILGIAGGEGCGKSFLFAAIVKHLQELYAEATEDMKCTSICYYMFDQQEVRDASLIKGLEVLAWQIAKADMVYRKELGSVKITGINHVGSLFNQLFGRSYKTDSTFFLLVDGIEQMDKQHLKEFVQVLQEWQSTASTWPRFTLRILLVGRTETMDKIQTQIEDEISVIDLASANRDDMINFVNDRINKTEILDGSSEQVVTLRRDILETLTNGTNGDFVNVGLLLDEISRKKRPSEIRDILARSGENRSDTIARKVEMLNETLSDEDISDLNHLLTWVVFAEYPLTLEQLEAALFLKCREPSLRPLAENIRDQYSSLLCIQSARVYLVSDSMKDFFRTSSDSEGTRDDQDMDTVGDVSEAEVRIVRRFLESVCDPKLFNKFGFDEFFKRKMKGKTVRIAVDTETAHLMILSACLEVMCSKPSPNLKPLLQYAENNFGEHLMRADPSLIHPHQKIAIGPQLVKIFTDDEVINRWWRASSYRLRVLWIYDDDYAEVTLKWLQDSAVTKNISKEEKKWVKSLSSKSELDADLLEHVGRVCARKWLQYGPRNLEYVFNDVRGYITKIENRKDPKIERLVSDPDAEQVQTSHILDAAKWAQAQIGLDTLGYEENRNLARTLRVFGKYDEAIKHFKLTSTLAQDNWSSQWGLADCYAGRKEFTTAIEILEATKKGIENGETGSAEELKAELADMNRDLAEWNKEAGQSEVTLDIYEKLLQEFPDDYDTALALMTLLHKHGNYQRLLQFLQSMESPTDEFNNFNRQIQLFHIHSDRPEYHEALFASVHSDREFNIILKSYEAAIDAAKTRVAQGRKASKPEEEWGAQICQIELMYHLALLYYDNSAGNFDRVDLAINQWLQILHMNDNDDFFVADRKARAGSELAIVCYEKALQHPNTAASYLAQLENVAALKLGEDTIHGTYPARLLARYHALQGDEKKVKNVLRSYIKLNLDLLSDDDPLNDWQGYNGLAMHFMFAGHDADALAAWSLITPDDATGNTENPTTSDTTERKLEGPLRDICDGACGTYWTFANNFYLCRECNYIKFDQRCLDNLRNGTMKFKICDKDHEMLHIPAYDPVERRRIGDGNVKVGEEILSINEWLQRIRKGWGIQSAEELGKD